MKKIQNIIEKYNKIIFKISFINNFTNLKFSNFFVLLSKSESVKIYLLSVKFDWFK